MKKNIDPKQLKHLRGNHRGKYQVLKIKIISLNELQIRRHTLCQECNALVMVEGLVHDYDNEKMLTVFL